MSLSQFEPPSIEEEARALAVRMRAAELLAEARQQSAPVATTTTAETTWPPVAPATIEIPAEAPKRTRKNKKNCRYGHPKQWNDSASKRWCPTCTRIHNDAHVIVMKTAREHWGFEKDTDVVTCIGTRKMEPLMAALEADGVDLYHLIYGGLTSNEILTLENSYYNRRRGQAKRGEHNE